MKALDKAANAHAARGAAKADTLNRNTLNIARSWATLGDTRATSIVRAAATSTTAMEQANIAKLKQEAAYSKARVDALVLDTAMKGHPSDVDVLKNIIDVFQMQVDLEKANAAETGGVNPELPAELDKLKDKMVALLGGQSTTAK